MSLYQLTTHMKRYLVVSLLLLMGLMADVVLNDLNVHAMSDSLGGWGYPQTVPRMGKNGADLSILKNGAAQIFEGKNPYNAEVAYPPPPFAAVFFYPFTWMTERTAYFIQYWLLISFNLGSILLITYCLYKTTAVMAGPNMLLFPVAALSLLVMFVALSGQFHGYGLEFALERGNFDSYVLFLSSMALALMVLKPDGVIIPIVLLSAASHLKIYPAILLLLPLLQSWRRAWLPLVVVNLVMLFIFGPRMVFAFLSQIIVYMDNAFVWPGNHSIAAYVRQIVVPAFPAPNFDPDFVSNWASRMIALGVIGVWFHGIFRFRRIVPKSLRWLLMAALSFPVMGALSSTSHDYKLVIYVLPIVVNLYLFSRAFLTVGSVPSVVGLVLTLVCFVAINHSTIIGTWPFLETKFPAILLLLLLTYLQSYVGVEDASDGGEHLTWRSRRRELVGLGFVAGAMLVFAAGHMWVKLRGKQFAEQANMALDFGSSRLTQSVRYGTVTLDLQLPGTAAGIAEPLLVCGRPGNATLVYVKFLADMQARVGVEFWGAGAVESEAFDIRSANGHLLVSCSLPCLYPELGDVAWHGMGGFRQRQLSCVYTIAVEGVTRLEGPILYQQPSRSPVYYGRNPLGGSLVSSAFTGKLGSVKQAIK